MAVTNNKPTGTGYTDRWLNRTDANLFDNLDTHALLEDLQKMEAQEATKSGTTRGTTRGTTGSTSNVQYDHSIDQYLDAGLFSEGLTRYLEQEADRQAREAVNQEAKTTTAAQMQRGNVQG